MDKNPQLPKCEYIDDKTILTQDFLFKVLVPSGVGKTCILARATTDSFIEEHSVTLGVEFGSFLTKILNKYVRLQIWDTAGQESFKSVTRIFYKGIDCAFLVYDITKKETFDQVVDWYKEVKNYAPANTVVILVGNKSDSTAERKVSYEDGSKLKADNNFAMFIETSAKTGANVRDVCN